MANRQSTEEAVKSVMDLVDVLCIESAKIALQQLHGVYEIGTDFINARSAIEREFIAQFAHSYWRKRYQQEHHERLRLQRELNSKE